MFFLFPLYWIVTGSFKTNIGYYRPDARLVPA